MANNHKPEGKPATCVQCGQGGGTLVKVKDGPNPYYRHQRPQMCRRKEVRNEAEPRNGYGS